MLLNIFYYPVVWWVIVPVGLVSLFVALLVWESKKGKVKITDSETDRISHQKIV